MQNPCSRWNREDSQRCTCGDESRKYSFKFVHAQKRNTTRKRSVYYVSKFGKKLIMMCQCKLSHMLKQSLKIWGEQNLLPGLKKVSLPFCEHYITSKQHRLKFTSSNDRSKAILELIHSNIWQAPVMFLGGARYFVSFIDEYFRICWVYPIKIKVDIFSVFKIFKTQVKLEFEKKIKCSRTNNVGLFTSDEFNNFCQQECIKRKLMIGYTPHKNGVIEQMN